MDFRLLEGINATGNETMEPDPFLAFVTTDFVAASWCATIYGIFALGVIWKLNIYTEYPSRLLVWLVMLEVFSVSHYGIMKWWPKSTLHDVLAIAPTPVACYVVIFIDTFILVGGFCIGILVAKGFYETLSPMRVITADSKQSQLKKSALFFLVVSVGCSCISLTSGYKLVGWCQIDSQLLVTIKLITMFALFTGQVYYISKCILLVTGFTNISSSRKLKRMEKVLCVRFMLVLFTQAIQYIPWLSIEVIVNYAGNNPLWLVFLTHYGLFLGTIVDASSLLFHRKVLGVLVCNYQPFQSSKGSRFSSVSKRSVAPSKGS